MDIPLLNKLKNLGITKLAAICVLLLTAIFIILWPKTSKLLLLPQISPIAQNQPVTRLSLISPQPHSTVWATVPLIFTFSNGPKITEAKLFVNQKAIQTVFSQETDKLTIYWDSTKTADGSFQIEVHVKDTSGRIAVVATNLNVKNNVARSVN